LIGVDGSVLTTIPENLVYLKVTWSAAPTLAEGVVTTRPDRYALTGARLGRPDTFALKGSGFEPLDVGAVARQRRWLFWALMGGMVVLGVVGVVLLYARPA